ncbi:MAG: hypothetical protein ACFB02_14025 [Mastigocoleus sp.]
MHKKSFKSRPRQVLLQVVTKSLFISLLAISSTPASAQKQEIEAPNPKETLIPTQIPTSTEPKPSSVPGKPNEVKNPIAQKLLGTWEAKNPANPSSSENVTFIFGSAGKMFIVMSSASSNPIAYETKYKIDSKQKPMHLDVILVGRDETVLTIFEFVDDDKIKVEVEKSRPGKPRPKNFPTNTPVFEKVSQSTILPKDVKLLSPGGQQSNNGRRINRKESVPVNQKPE